MLPLETEPQSLRFKRPRILKYMIYVVWSFFCIRDIIWWKSLPVERRFDLWTLNYSEWMKDDSACNRAPCNTNCENGPNGQNDCFIQYSRQCFDSNANPIMSQVCIDSGLGQPFAGEICPGIDSKNQVPTVHSLRRPGQALCGLCSLWKLHRGAENSLYGISYTV